MKVTLFALALSLIGNPFQAGKSTLVAKLEILAARNDPQALYYLGMSYLVGSEVAIDHEKALTYLRRSAELGDPLAAYKIGCFHAGQYGVLPVNHDAALTNKLVAAKAGYALAQQDVARIYSERGDAQTAGEWIARAAAQGTRSALFAYASIHNGANGLPRNGAAVIAYSTLFLRQGKASPSQIRWLEEQRAALSAEERARADALIASYRPAPTPLTIAALSGQRAAEVLVGRME